MRHLLVFVALASSLAASPPIDRHALVARNNPVVTTVDPWAPLTVGNGGFAFTVDVTGLQTFGDHYYANGIPLETLARWCWVTEANPENYTVADANRDYVQPDGTTLALPSNSDEAAGQWLRRNPRLHPLGQLALDWRKPDGSPFTPADIVDPHQTLDQWTGVITSHFTLGAEPVSVRTSCAPDSDTIAIELESPLVARGELRLRLRFPRGHDPSVKNTPAFDWSQPESHRSELRDTHTIAREVLGTTYTVTTSLPITPDAAAPHTFAFEPNEGTTTLALSLRYSESVPTNRIPEPAAVRAASAAHWEQFWTRGAAVDLTGSTNPLAPKLERRIVQSQYLTAVQSVGEVPPQESGLTCNTWYGKHHTEMIWWHTAHFVLWGRPDLAATNLDWFVRRLPEARTLAASRNLAGARWAKMVGPDMRESPGGNPLIVWNQPHPIYLAELLRRHDPAAAHATHYFDLVQDTAACLATMLQWDETRGTYVLGPPLWIAQEIHDQATSQNPSFELAYWRWALETAQTWRERAGLERNADWDHRLAHLPPLATDDGKYVALESHPDTWTNLNSRHDHPQMLMPLGFLPGGPDVDRATMDRTLDAVLADWDWETKIWGWDYPMIAMTATRLNRPQDAIEVLLRDGPNNRYAPNGHCPQGSDRARQGAAPGRTEIAVYLPANGSFLSAVALMIAGWEGNETPHPGIPNDGTWTVRAEGLQPLP
ncbi:hypothetical protein [Actomonas aquatica]|uniref:Glycoside hydrolase family 65 n=1 Tax=Actomonas aquatica TaxID=2866162 RepID=A0ABZ1C526_9BACT|nr:hypothetical protein [Opitutus sp. WL0086]WRQ86581.1 hypothetical protein K1X11_017350 [Opitutus sp. WL0086]